MKALFVTSATNDVDSLVRAWNCWQTDKSLRVMYPHRGKPRDNEILAAAKEMAPDIIFYIGACEGSGVPTMETLLTLRGLAPSINLCCDAGDEPWHEPLRRYKEAGCFDLQVTLDGHRGAPVDLVTITPVDPSPYTQQVSRTIRCGFSGGVSAKDLPVFKTRFPSRAAPKITKFRPKGALPAWRPLHKIHMSTSMERTSRDQVVWDLESSKDTITVRQRTSKSPYIEHAAFLLSCHMIVNTSASGSGDTHHIKGRVLEAGWAGCALLESDGSPISEWMPEGSFFIYRDIEHAKNLIDSLTDNEISASATMLRKYVQDHYHPRKIYGEILKRADVDTSKSR